MGEFCEFPPALQRKYGRSGEWFYPQCSPECEAREERREWETSRREHLLGSLLRRSGVSKRLERATFENFDTTYSVGARRAYGRGLAYVVGWEERKAEGAGLYLHGGVGTGKTHVAAAIMRRLVEEARVPSLFVTVPELLDHLRPNGPEGEGERDAWAESVKNAEFLVLDDLGAEKTSGWVQERLFVLINHRYREELPTVYTSNVSPGELGARIGERTASRVIETSEFVSLEGPDYRLEARRGQAGAER